MAAELFTASEGVRRLGVPTKELLRLVRNREIRYVMVRGSAHIPDHALDEYELKPLSFSSCEPIRTQTGLDPTGPIAPLYSR